MSSSGGDIRVVVRKRAADMLLPGEAEHGALPGVEEGTSIGAESPYRE